MLENNNILYYECQILTWLIGALTTLPWYLLVTITEFKAYVLFLTLCFCWLSDAKMQEFDQDFLFSDLLPGMCC